MIKTDETVKHRNEPIGFLMKVLGLEDNYGMCLLFQGNKGSEIFRAGRL